MDPEARKNDRDSTGSLTCYPKKRPRRGIGDPATLVGRVPPSGYLFSGREMLDGSWAPILWSPLYGMIIGMWQYKANIHSYVQGVEFLRILYFSHSLK